LPSFFAWHILKVTVEPEEWAKAHFFIAWQYFRADVAVFCMNRKEAVEKVEEIAERVARAEGIEVVEVELKGSGRNQLLRIFIDKPAGVTHADCEFVSQQVGTILDVEDPIPGSYNLEVSSPGVERKLRKWEDWPRFTGKKAKVVLKEPAPVAGTGDNQGHGNLKHFEGLISRAENRTVTVELPGGGEIVFPFEQIERANLKFEW
jgi:ribosome maturation factor RimP